jgi:RNA recognition motif-containing protein
MEVEEIEEVSKGTGGASKKRRRDEEKEDDHDGADDEAAVSQPPEKAEKLYVMFNGLKWPAHPYTVYVTDLEKSAAENDLAEVFCRCGPMLAIKVVKDKRTNEGKGVAFVQFEEKNSVEKALAFDDAIAVCGKVIRVSRSRFPALAPVVYEKPVDPEAVKAAKEKKKAKKDAKAGSKAAIIASSESLASTGPPATAAPQNVEMCLEEPAAADSKAAAAAAAPSVETAKKSLPTKASAAMFKPRVMKIAVVEKPKAAANAATNSSADVVLPKSEPATGSGGSGQGLSNSSFSAMFK